MQQCCIWNLDGASLPTCNSVASRDGKWGQRGVCALCVSTNADRGVAVTEGSDGSIGRKWGTKWSNGLSKKWANGLSKKWSNIFDRHHHFQNRQNRQRARTRTRPPERLFASYSTKGDIRTHNSTSFPPAISALQREMAL